MTAMALNGLYGSLVRGSPAAGEEGRKSALAARRAIAAPRMSSSQGSLVFAEFFELAKENVGFRSLATAQRFLLALPAHIPVPSLSMDDDGDVVLDWKGKDGALLTIAVGVDGRLAYSSYAGPMDRDHGTKVFSGVIPKSLMAHIERIGFD